MKLPDKVRYFNKRFLNKVTARVARAGWGPFAIIYHVGRRSGKCFETPIFVFPAPDGFVIALTYGPQVDWYKNILAAQHCRVLYHHREYEIDKVEPLDRKAALPLFPPFFEYTLGHGGMQDFTRLWGRPV